VIELLKVVILGIVEGVTEFLPISSTGHLIVATAILQPAFSPALENTFEIFIQFGAVIAVVIYYWGDLWMRVRAIPHDPAARRFWLGLVVATIPAALIGLLLRDFIKETLFNPIIVALALIIGGVALILVERRFSKTTRVSSDRVTDPTMTDAAPDQLYSVTMRQAALIGFVQVIALIPGVSRAAASIIGGMGVGLTRETATRFSFYLAIPTLAGATILDLLLSLDEIQSGDLVYLIIGAAVAGVVAWAAIGWLLRYIARHSFTAFGIYRIIAGAIILIAASVWNWQIT
jgi:undecaprenyl-diphosphatase